MKVFTTVECKASQRKRLEKLVRPDQIYFGNYDDLNSNDEQAFLESEVAFGGCPPSWLTKTSRLRWMQLDSVGFGEYVHLDWPDLSKQITCTNLVGFFATPVAETVLAGILFFYRGIDRLIELQARRSWRQIETRPQLSRLSGATVMLVGYGFNSQRLHSLLRPFDCRIWSMNKYAPQADLQTVAELDARLPESDIVCVSLPETPDTNDLFNQHRFSRCKEGSIFVNVGRGSVVEETALIENLRSGHLRGAIIDVTKEEPLSSEHRLWDAPNTLVTQHTAGGFKEEIDEKISLFEENLDRYRNGKPLKNVIDWARGY